MEFWGTEATISDEQGNFLISSNGVWIANATGDTMMNGGGLNPGSNVNSFPDGILNPFANLILPFPGDSTKYILIHHTDEWDGFSYPSYKVFSTQIDITLDGGLGGVTSKNTVVFTDTMNWGFGACRHANGRDWWVVSSKHNSNKIFKFLITSGGIFFYGEQTLNVPVAYYNVTHLSFNNQGTNFSYYVYDSLTLNSSLIIADFDRCTGTFYNETTIPITLNSYLWGISYSPSGQFVYVCSSAFIFQIELGTFVIDTVAVYDGFISGLPPTCCATTFFLMYLAANGKIYVTSGSSTQHIHEINYPDSAGVACDVQQHAINVGVWQFRAVPNHPNYYLGAADGTICDSLGLNSLHDTGYLEQSFTLKPNPNSGVFEVLYLLPQGEEGTLEVYDISGKRIYSQYLPPWSTMQGVSLPEAVPAGLYNAVIRSDRYYAARKFVLN